MIIIRKITELPGLTDTAARWFASKWSVPAEAYAESMEDAVKHDINLIPQWYVVMEEEKIIGGCGLIENDFHERKDLTPNLCALFVEETHRCRGIAGQLLNFVCKDLAKTDIKNLYLITDHTDFYERYGWTFLTMVKGDDGEMTRMYVKNIDKSNDTAGGNCV